MILNKFVLLVLVLTSILSCSSKPKTNPEGEKPQITEVPATPNLNNIYENLKHYTKNGISAEHRELSWRRLYEAKTLDQKLFHAADYIDSFDFQAWNWGFADALIQEDQKLKDHVVAHDLLELSLGLTGLLSKLDPRHSEDVFTKDRNLQSFYAIAASLSDVVPPPTPDHVNHSMYEFIQQGLQKEKDLNYGQIVYNSLSKSEMEVVKNAQLFKDTFYARFQYLAYIAHQTYKTNPEEALVAVNFALSTREFLHSIGMEVKLDKKIKKHIKHITSNSEELNNKIKALVQDPLAQAAENH